MHPTKILFSVNEYDFEGDLHKKGVFLHFGDTRVLAADSIKDFSAIIEHFESMVAEIETNYL